MAPSQVLIALIGFYLSHIQAWISCAVLVLTQQRGLCLYFDDFGYFFNQHNHCGLLPSSQCIFLDPVQEFYGRAKVKPLFCTAQLGPYFLLILSLLCTQVWLFLSH